MNEESWKKQKKHLKTLNNIDEVFIFYTAFMFLFFQIW